MTSKVIISHWVYLLCLVRQISRIYLGKEPGRVSEPHFYQSLGIRGCGTSPPACFMQFDIYILKTCLDSHQQCLWCAVSITVCLPVSVCAQRTYSDLFASPSLFIASPLGPTKVFVLGSSIVSSSFASYGRVSPALQVCCTELGLLGQGLYTHLLSPE